MGNGDFLLILHGHEMAASGNKAILVVCWLLVACKIVKVKRIKCSLEALIGRCLKHCFTKCAVSCVYVMRQLMCC